jgi:polygalacturonase
MWMLALAGLVTAAVDVSVLDCGCVPNDGTDNTAAFRNCALRAAGGTLRVPKGVFVSGGFSLSSHTTLLLEAGAVVYASDNVRNYECLPSITVDTGVCDYALVTVANATGVSIVGEGTLNGGFNDPPGHLVKYYDPKLNFLYPLDLPFPRCSPFNCRIKLVVFYNCSDVVLESVSLHASPLWTLQLGLCSGVTVSRLNISSDRRQPNGDGIDVVSSSNVLIDGCTIDTGDDCVDISTHVVGVPSRNVTVSNCKLSSSSGAQNIGMFAVADIEHVVFRGNVVRNTNRGIGILPRIGRGTIRNLRYEDIDLETRFFSDAFWGSGEPVYIAALNFEEGFQGAVENVSFERLRCNSTNGITIRGLQIANVSFVDVFVHLNMHGNVSSPRHDWRPLSGSSQGPELQPALLDAVYVAGPKEAEEGPVDVRFDRLCVDMAVNASLFGVCFNNSLDTAGVTLGAPCVTKRYECLQQ